MVRGSGNMNFSHLHHIGCPLHFPQKKSSGPVSEHGHNIWKKKKKTSQLYESKLPCFAVKMTCHWLYCCS